jgi:phasin protein
MTAKPDDLAIKAWKQQLDTALRVVETITEGSMKIRESQLQAAIEAHAGVEATRKLLEKATDAQELWRIQSEWMSASLQKSLTYWRELYQAAAETQSSVAKCLCVQTPLFGPQAPVLPEASKDVLLNMMDTAYKRWLDTTRQFYAAPVISPPQVREAA